MTQDRLGRTRYWQRRVRLHRSYVSYDFRDPRLAVHGATSDQDLVEGDAKPAGTAIATESNRYVEATGRPAPVGSAVFTVDLDLVVLTRVDGDELVIDQWTPRWGHRLVSRP